MTCETLYTSSPCSHLIIGVGGYANALAQIIGVEAIAPEVFNKDPEPLRSGSYPCVFDSLTHILLVVDFNPTILKYLGDTIDFGDG